jgi:hypothetical protein
VRGIHAVAAGGRAGFDRLYHPRASGRETRIQPPSSRVPGPASFCATALWPRAAPAGPHYDIRHAIADGSLAAVNSTRNGRHAAPRAACTGGGAAETVFPPANQTFAMTQTHWSRIEDGQIIEHRAHRDDPGTARQLRRIPPTPAYLLKTARAKRHAGRS